MKKKIVTTILMFCMALGLCACGGDAGNSENTENSQNTQQESESAKDSDSESAGNNSESTGANSESESGSGTELAEGEAYYKVMVVDESGKPRGGVLVQVCNDETCFLPEATNGEGVATFKLTEGEGYKALITNPPAGYEAVEKDYVNFETGKTEITLQIKPKE